VKILVPCKRVPNPDLKLKVANGSVDLASTTWQVNPFDEYAVEAALRLTEKARAANAWARLWWSASAPRTPRPS